MGLDMYLQKHTYVGNNWKEPDNQIKFGIPGVKDSRVSVVVEQVGYWRKANAIHNWFVRNVQKGVDDCGDYFVPRFTLKALLTTVNTVLSASTLIKGKVKTGQRLTSNGWEDIMEDGRYIKDPSSAHELLPTTDGFFFGSTDYDESYYDDLVETKRILEEVLQEEGDFYYHSSW